MQVQTNQKKKLLLIKSRIEKTEKSFFSPPLGIMSLAAVARERCGWDVRLIDTFLPEEPESEILNQVNGWKPDVVGISALTSESLNMHRYAKLIRKALPKAIILAGGPHPTHYPDETLENHTIDAAVINEGEITFIELLNAIVHNRPWQGIDGIAIRGDNGNMQQNPTRSFIQDLDSLPFPAWDLVDIGAYAVHEGMTHGNRRYMPIMTSRGCPYQCTYCHEMWGKKFRSHSPAYVLRMISTLVDRYKVFHFDIFDDIFNLDRKRMKVILDELIENGPSIRFSFPNAIRADILTEEEIDKICRAGCEYVCLAIETASPRLQKHIKKNLNIEKSRKSIEAFAKRRVFTVGFFMVGFPTETEEEMKHTINFAVRSKLHLAYFFTVTPYQGTRLHESVKDKVGNNVRELTTNYLQQNCNLSEIPDERFFKLKGTANLRFYFRPSRAYRIWRDIPQRNTIWRAIKGLIIKTMQFMTGRARRQKSPKPVLAEKTSSSQA